MSSRRAFHSLGLAFIVLSAACAASEPAAPKAPQAAKAAAAEGAATPAGQASADGSALVLAVDPVIGPAWPSGKRDRYGVVRTAKSAQNIDVEGLPVAVIPSPLEDKDIGATAAGDTPAPEIDVQKQANSGYGYGYGYNYGYQQSYQQATVNGLTFGTIKVGNREAVFWAPPAAQAGVFVACGTYERNTAARWEGFSKDGDTPTYEIVDGWLDATKCKVYAKKRTTFAVKEIIPGRLFGYKQCTDEKCSDGKVSVGFIMRGVTQAVTQGGPLRSSAGVVPSRVVLPVRKGGSESLLASVQSTAPWGNGAWNVSVEIQQGIEDQAPLATAFLDAPK